jgi:hypothetical protein
MFSDPNSMGSAWQVWVWGNLSSEEWQDSTCEHGEGVGSLGSDRIIAFNQNAVFKEKYKTVQFKWFNETVCIQ